MTASRFTRSLVSALALSATFAGASLLPRLAKADVSSNVADIAAKGTIPATVPVEAGLGLGLAAALLAVGMDRRARR